MTQTTFHPYPLWIGASIALLVVGGGIATLAVSMARAFGRNGLVALAAALAGLFAWIFLSDPAPTQDPIRRFSGWAALCTCILAFAVAPTAFLWLSEGGRAPGPFWRQVGFTLLSVVGTLVAIGVLAGAVGIAIHVLRS